jgi:hypothetical protein
MTESTTMESMWETTMYIIFCTWITAIVWICTSIMDDNLETIGEIQKRNKAMTEDKENVGWVNRRKNNKSVTGADSEMEKEPNVTCKICDDPGRNHVISPCGHTGYCGKCLITWTKRKRTCPECRIIIGEYFEIFL